MATFGSIDSSVTITGTGAPVLGTSPTLVTPDLGTPTALVGTNITGTASGLTAGNVTTNANLTGVVTSTGNATAIADAALSIAKTSGLQTALDAKAPLASPTFTGTLTSADHVITVANAANKIGLTITQNDTTNNRAGLKIVSAVNTTSTTEYPFMVESTNAGGNGAFIQTYHNSASPLATDYVGGWDSFGNDSAANKTYFGGFNMVVDDVTDTTEDSHLVFSVRTAGTTVEELTLDGASLKPVANDGLALGTATLSYADLFLASGGVINFNNSDVTLTHSADVLTMAGGGLTLAAGTTAIAPLKYTSGTNLTSAVAGGTEFDGVQFYQTIDTTSGRAALVAEQYFHLTANGSAITTIANFFGSTSNIAIVASGYYVIDAYMWYVTTGTGTVTFTFTNSAAPTSQNILWEMSPVGGVVAPPGTATMLVGQTLNDATAARTVVTGSLTAGTHYAHIKIWLKNSTGTSLKIQATAGGTNLTPQIGSWWHARRVSPNNIGTFVA